MNTYKERFSAFVRNNKKKIIISMSTLGLLTVFNMPTINGLREKYIQQNKIDKRPDYEHDIQQLFEQLGYTDRAHTLRMNDTNDIDLGHLNGSQDTMESLLHKFSCLKESDVEKIISIPGCWTSYSAFYRKTMKTRIQASYNCQVLREIQDRFNLSENEVIFMLSALMHLSLTEYVEYEQSQDNSVIYTSNSGNNSVDYRGNIGGIIANLENRKEHNISVSDIERILSLLQQHYHTVDAKSTFEALSQEFGLQVKISDQE